MRSSNVVRPAPGGGFFVKRLRSVRLPGSDLTNARIMYVIVAIAIAALLFTAIWFSGVLKEGSTGPPATPAPGTTPPAPGTTATPDPDPVTPPSVPPPSVDPFTRYGIPSLAAAGALVGLVLLVVLYRKLTSTNPGIKTNGVEITEKEAVARAFQLGVHQATTDARAIKDTLLTRMTSAESVSSGEGEEKADEPGGPVTASVSYNPQTITPANQKGMARLIQSHPTLQAALQKAYSDGRISNLRRHGIVHKESTSNTVEIQDVGGLVDSDVASAADSVDSNIRGTLMGSL